jgi:uncharacterized protein (TIGR03083 family)
MSQHYDAVIVGARCAGATLATLLARAGWRVLLLDSNEFPSDTVSTHVMFPDTLQRLDELGAMQRLTASHDIPSLGFSWRVLGHEVAGDFTPVGGFDRATCVRRVVLDAVLVDLAVDAGAELRTGVSVAGLIGSGQPGDPVRGVVPGTGERIEARWVFGADGRVSTVAHRLGVPAERELRGEMAFLLAYWRGLPPSGSCQIDVHEHAALMSTPCEDGLHLLSLAGAPGITRGGEAVRADRYQEGLRQFPAVLNHRLLDRAEQVSPLVVVPETMMRGHFRRAAGDGWALLGDAGHFKHPSTAQGIGDAVHQAWFVAEALTAGGDLASYQQWRDARAEEHYEWSFDKARFGTRRGAALYSGIASDADASQEFLDTFTRSTRPSEVVTPARLSRWEAAWAYDEGRRAVRALVEDLPDEHLSLPVPACPGWTVRDLVAHLVGVAEDTVAGTYFDAAADAWRDPALAAARDTWTAEHVATRAGWDRETLLRGYDDATTAVVAAIRAGLGGPRWKLTAPVADLSVHLLDLADALDAETRDADAALRLGFAVYRSWLAARITESGLPALRLGDGERTWTLGSGEPAATLTADRHELFRAISGRRSAARVRGYAWDGDPTPYLAVISPYPLPPNQTPAANAAVSTTPTSRETRRNP